MRRLPFRTDRQYGGIARRAARGAARRSGARGVARYSGVDDGTDSDGRGLDNKLYSTRNPRQVALDTRRMPPPPPPPAPPPPAATADGADDGAAADGPPRRFASVASLPGMQTFNALYETAHGAAGSRTGQGDDAETPAVLSDEVRALRRPPRRPTHHPLPPPPVPPQVGLVGRPVVRVEPAPGNARRIFTGIDIVASGCDVEEKVWATLTDYEGLAAVVPNLVKNEVLDFVPQQGARLRQVGAAKLAPGITFTATTTLDVREYRNGILDEMEADHLRDPRATAPSRRPIRRRSARRRRSSRCSGTSSRGRTASSLPHRDITMQGVRGTGDFRFYQGVWRMQPPPGCAPPALLGDAPHVLGRAPRARVPVALLEGRIALRSARTSRRSATM